jgi:hypothetical protein
VLTGKDTASNFELLFGPAWKKEIEKIHHEARMEALLEPPPGSPCYVMQASLDGGFNAPRSVRPASEDENQTLREVRDLQARIGARFPPGTEITDHQSLYGMLGPNWAEKLDVFQLALNTTDQGVGV